MEIEASIEQVIALINSIEHGGTQYRALDDCVPVLNDSLLNNVFRKPHSDTSKIESKRELQSLIASGSKGSHVPAKARKGDPYNKEYLDRKMKMNEQYPHKYMEYGFWNMVHGGNVFVRKDELVMEVEPIYHRGFDYMSHHERRRSVLKRAFLDAWQEIIETIKKRIKKDIQVFGLNFRAY